MTKYFTNKTESIAIKVEGWDTPSLTITEYKRNLPAETIGNWSTCVVSTLLYKQFKEIDKQKFKTLRVKNLVTPDE